MRYLSPFVARKLLDFNYPDLAVSLKRDLKYNRPLFTQCIYPLAFVLRVVYIKCHSCYFCCLIVISEIMYYSPSSVTLQHWLIYLCSRRYLEFALKSAVLHSFSQRCSHSPVLWKLSPLM